jgi:hypothetical protein
MNYGMYVCISRHDTYILLNVLTIALFGCFRVNHFTLVHNARSSSAISKRRAQKVPNTTAICAW